MYRRIRRLRNKCGDITDLKLAKEGLYIEILDTRDDFSITTKVDDGEEYVYSLNFECGPVLEIGAYINLTEFGNCKILGIYPSMSNKKNEWLLEILNIDGKKRRRK
tara:strand:- start:184 stop:501 length:318 start_codon:yes stop_codon:yes gene_type:complete